MTDHRYSTLDPQAQIPEKPPEPPFRNYKVDKKGLRNLIAWAFSRYGTARTAIMADHLKNLGFRHATQAAVSISVEDLQVPPRKRELLKRAETEIESALDRYTRGEITEVERYQRVIDTWNQTNDEIKNQMLSNFEQNDPLNSVYMMANSGARGNVSQVRQLVGMRGLMANPQGEIIDLPIKSNFREGLTVTEYIISSYGARKGLVDTALRTADSGYLTRRLVDVSQDVIVRELDCGTLRGIKMETLRDAEKVIVHLDERLVGRVLAEDAIDQETGEVVAPRNREINAELAKELGRRSEYVIVRSPLTCEANRSVCRLCYGWSLAHSHLVDMGEAVGIIAAQSIGEPGTQLTMRTFHTGGVFTGEVARQLKAPAAGTIKFPAAFRTRPLRTRHGDDALLMESNQDIILITDDGREESFPVTIGTTLMVRDGSRVKPEQLIAEVPLAKAARKSTEKAQKEVISNLAGEIRFSDLPIEEKTDRQGNVTAHAQRQGLIWVMSGQVYNLPPGAEPSVKNGDGVDVSSVIAETSLTTEHGGIVRLPERQDIKSGREVEIINASVVLREARVRVESHQGREQYLLDTANGQTFILKTTPGTKVGNDEVVAELIESDFRTTTGGLVKFAGLEVAKRGKAKQGYEVIQGGTLLWIPEETHEVNKDISLLNVEDGQYVEASTEVVKDIFAQNSGVVEVIQKNDILREIIIKPGSLHLVDNPADMEVKSGTLIQPGQQVLSSIVPEALVYVEHVESPEGPALLLRPVEEHHIPSEPSVPSQESTSESGRSIRLRAVQRIPFKDGERVRSVSGVELLKTQLVLEIDTEAHHQLKADIELTSDEAEPDLQRLQMVILETILVRRDVVADLTQGSTQTRLLVEEGDTIQPGDVIARTEIQAKQAGIVQGLRQDSEVVRRLLLVTEDDTTVITCDQPPQVKPEDLIKTGDPVAPGVISPESGVVMEVTENSVKVRVGRPYLMSAGAVLQVGDGDLVQRGDSLGLLVFERAKTGDIVQGLPRIEELLEARKPKEMCVLNRRPGTVQLTWRGEEPDLKVVEQDGTVLTYPLLPGQSIIVVDGQPVEVGESLTDGPANPHDLLECYYTYHRQQLGDDQASQIALREVQRFLVNEVQNVYRSQGVEIADKHIEVVVRQMTSKVRVDDSGDTILLPGELVDLREIQQTNSTMAITGGAPAQYTPVLLGITKASLNTDSFISAASFQETTRVLTEAAIEGKSDWLRGLKENVIIGRLIPAGTGFSTYEEIGPEPEPFEEEEPSSMILDDLPSPPRLVLEDDQLIDDSTQPPFDGEAEDEDKEEINPLDAEFSEDEGEEDEED